MHLDLGSGDGCGPYRWALREPFRLFIASDANASALAETAWRAGRKPARGGTSNLLCIGEPLHVLGELGPVADRITIILPWGSLLRAVARPEIGSLRHIAHLCLPGATVEVVLSYDQQRDAGKTILPAGEKLDEEHIVIRLPFSYEQAGLHIVAIERLPQQDLAAYETTWAGRLAFGRPREVWRIRARG